MLIPGDFKRLTQSWAAQLIVIEQVWLEEAGPGPLGCDPECLPPFPHPSLTFRFLATTGEQLPSTQCPSTAQLLCLA